MKNYAMTDEEKKSFILRLKFTDTSIIACMADGTEEVHENNNEELITLLEKMKQQVLDADNFLKREKKIYNDYIKWLIIFSTLYAVLWFSFISSFIIAKNPITLTEQLTFIISSFLISRWGAGCAVNVRDSKRNIDDVMKHRLYLENIDALNNCLTYDFSKVSEETKNLVRSGLDINKVDKISRKEMEYIVGDRPKGRIRRRF